MHPVHISAHTVDDRREQRDDIPAVRIVDLLHFVDHREALDRVDDLQCLVEQDV